MAYLTNDRSLAAKHTQDMKGSPGSMDLYCDADGRGPSVAEVSDSCCLPDTAIIKRTTITKNGREHAQRAGNIVPMERYTGLDYKALPGCVNMR